MGLIKCVCVAVVMKTTPLPKIENFDGLVVIFCMINVKGGAKAGTWCGGR